MPYPRNHQGDTTVSWVKRLQLHRNWFLIVVAGIAFWFTLRFAKFPPETSLSIPQVSQTVNYAALIAESTHAPLDALSIVVTILSLIGLVAIGWFSNIWVKILISIGMFGFPVLCDLFSTVYWVAADTTILKEEAHTEFQGEIYHFARMTRITDGAGMPGYFYILLKCNPSGESCLTLYSKVIFTYEQLGDLFLDASGDALHFTINDEIVYTVQSCGDVVCLIPDPTPAETSA
jgi:hypothetical protein